MLRKRNDYPKAKSRSSGNRRGRRGVSFFLAGLMAFSAVAPGLSSVYSMYSVYGVTPDKPVNGDGSIPNGNKPQDTINTEEVYINDTPIRLQVSKVKTAKGDHEGLNPKTVEATLADTITYKVSGRIEGAEHDLMDRYGKDQIELAYSPSGTYLGYGWLKGTLEYLSQRKLQNVDEEIDIKYNQLGIFEGYAYVTKRLETADDVNRYVAGATMTLYDAVEIFYDPSAEYDMDDKWSGVTVVREPGSNNVQMVYVNKGHAGNRIEYVLQEEDESKIEIDGTGTVVNDNYNYQDAINDEGGGVWIAKSIQREDTPILFYSFDNLHVTTNDEYVANGAENRKKVDEVFGSQRYNKEDSLYGFDKEGNVINADQYDNRDFSIYAFEDGETKPVFEFTGSNFRNIHYSQNDKKFRFYDEDRNEDKEMRMYHLDEDGNRDAMVDPATGIAYLAEHIKPLENEDSHDNSHFPNDDFISDNDIKVFVWPVNTFYDGTGNADDNTKGSHYFQKIITTRPATINADTPEEYVFGTLADGKFENSLNPVLDQYGHPVYNRVSKDTYVKGFDRYDYDGEEYLGYTYEDGLDVWNENAYVINDHYHLYNTDEDDPFNQETHYQYTDKQPIKVTVDVDNNFVVNGSSTVPVPSREGYVFAGWLLEPDQLTDQCTVKAYWRNGNNSMPPEEEAMWYSSRAAEGQIKTMTVTFDANGGAFRAGQGDIHSTDFPLYRRLGDAYIINNTWVTGENTPNDPFDTTLIDTVDNTAAGKNTISHDGLTGNDVYSSSTHSGGQADMLKRLPRSLYIMEELEAPAGYVKGMPVPITMNEMDNVQQAEMVDHTIKVEIVKTDATGDYYKKIRRNGELVMSAGGEPVTKIEPKGAYSYRHVKGATLSMKGEDSVTKKAFSDWVSITSCADFVKKNSGGTWYIEFDTTKPLFLEGIPAGTYTISEVKTPGGFVTMAPQTITVGEYEGVQLFTMADDHIKVEIEKYWTDEDGTRKLLDNANPAKLGLYDADGILVGSWYTNDASDYTSGGESKEKAPEGNLFTRAWKSLTSVFGGRAASDDTDYTAFTTRFQSIYNDGHTDMDQISWNVKRTATLKAGSKEGAEVWTISDGTEVAVTGGIVSGDAPEGFETAYAAKEDGADSFEYAEVMSAVKDKAATTSIGDQYWNVSNGTVIHICASVDDDSSSAGYQSYIMDYQFEYEKLAGKYDGAVTYLTVDSTRRFDYLPKGTYKVRELEAPEGFAITGEKEIKVEETGDIQIFDIENKKKEMKITKYTVDGNGKYFAGYYDNEIHYTADRTKAAVVAGVNLELYRSEAQIANPAVSFKDGKTPAGAVLVDSWTTGNDGSYTQYEYDRELITQEMIGQLKPHTIKDVKDGWYYLVEREGMSYMLDAPPAEFHVTQETTDSELTGYAMINRPAPLAVRVNKTDENNAPLANAVFELTNKDTGAVIGTLITDENGEASMNVADTGRFGQDGKLIPYTFILRETAAPSGYMLNAEQHEFTLTEQNDGYTCSMFNNSDSSLRGGILYVKNRKSELSISKKDLYSNNIVSGTVLEITKAEYTDGKWHSDGNKRSEWTWTVAEGMDEFGIKGITPDTTYVLHESKVPSGYTAQGDVFFHINKDGLGIDKIWTDPEETRFLSFDVDAAGEVEAMHTSTRTIAGTKAVITDLDSGQSFERGVEKNGRILLTAQDVVEGHRYSVRTYVTMSDASVHAVDSITFVAELVDNEIVVWGQYASDPRVTITDSDGNTIYEIAADGTDTVILNPETGHADTLTVADVSQAGKNRSGVKAGDVITYQVDYQGKGKRIAVYPGLGLTITRTEPGALPAGDGSYIYETTAETGTLTITANVNSDALTDVSLKVVSGNSQLTYLNPVVTTGNTGFYAGNDSLVISNAVAGTDPENGTAEFSYTVTLTDADGNALSGSYDYRTRLYSGTLDAFGEQKAFTMVLTGDDYLVINGLPADTRYKITAGTKVSDGFKQDRATAEGMIREDATVDELFTNTRNITSERALLKKGQSYYLNEVIKLSDRSHVTAGYGFSLDDMCRVVNFILLNRPSTVAVEKLEKESQTLLAGAVLTITDEDGNTLADAEGNPLTWTTTKDTKEFVGILDPGKTYFLKELSAPEGYTVSEPIPFTVSADGAVDRIIMLDSMTDVRFKKTDAKTGLSLAGATLQVIDKDGAVVAEWTTDETGTFEMKAKLTAGESYILHEEKTVSGYYYSYDVPFTVNTDGKSQTIEMRNRPIIVVTDEKFPDNPPAIGTYPSYTMEKERVSLAPAKKDTERFGFFRGDKVLYDVTITNTGETRLTMDVDDSYENPEYFTTPEVISVTYYADGSTQPSILMGKTNSISGSRANITIEAGAHAVVRYKAYVKDTAPESLSEHAIDDGLGYLNTATTTNVIGISREYSGEDKDGDGKGDIVTEKTVTKEDYPEELGDKEDTANTPVQESDGGDGDDDDITPSYVMDKTRPTEAPEKGETARYGFHRGDTVSYEARITNTGKLPLKMFVSDAYAPAVKDYFEDLQITKIEGAEDLSESGMGIGTDTAKIRLMPGETAVVTFTAVVSESAPESLSFMAADDGNGYLNTVRTYGVRAEKPDGTEGGPDEYPGIPDKEDDANTPVQTPSKEHEDYPFIWLVKGDKAQQGIPNQPVIPGGTYQVISKAEDGTETVMMELSDPDGDGKFTMTGEWKQWNIVLEADKTYYLREAKAPAGYILPDGDTAFTVSHYGEDVVAPIYNEKTKASFEKTDFAGKEVAGAECVLMVKQADGWKTIDTWVSQTGGPHTIEGVLETGKEYLYKETAAPEGYAYSASIRFTVGKDGTILHARYVDEAGKSLVYGSDGRTTDVTFTETMAGNTYQLNGEELTLVDGNLVDKAGKTVVEGAAVEIPVEDNVVVMKDEAVAASFEKTDFAGREIAGATCTLSEKKADGTEEQIDRWVSETGKSHVMENTLKIGATYLYHEELAAAGYGYSYDIEFTIDLDGKITDAHYLDPDGNKVLYDQAGFPTSIIAMNDGTYRDGATVITIDETGNAVDADGNIHAKGVALEIPVSGNVVTMKDEPVKTRFYKYDDEGNALEGGSYSICGMDGVPVKAVKDTNIPSLEHEGMILEGEDLTFAARKTGIRIDGLLEAGKSYTLKENEAPKGYSIAQASTSFEAPVYNQAEAITVSMANKKIPARFAKADENGNLIAGASLELYEKKADGTWGLIRTWRSTTQPMVLDGILESGKEYRYHEVKAPEGYRAAPDILFTVDEAGVIRNARYDGDDTEVKVVNNMITMTDKPLEVLFSKEDFAGKEVEGAECILYKKEADGTMTQIDAWTSTREKHAIPGKLALGETYIYHEEKAPEGYAYSESIEFTVGEDGNVTSAHYINDNGETILYDKDGYTTTITVQEDGTYKDGDTVVTINESGNAVDEDGNIIAEGVKKDMPITDNVVVMKDAPTNVTIKKTDSKTGLSLAGATLQVIDKDGKIVAEWTTDESGTFKLEKMLTAGETYTLREKETVDGYYYSYDIIFTVNEDGRPQVVEMRNREIIVVTPPDTPDEPDDEKPIIWLLKHAVGDPDHILQGGTFQVLSEDKSEVVIDSFTMDGTWQEWDVTLKADHSYWLHEVTPPEGYEKAEDVKFTVSHYGEDITVDMEDEPNKTIIVKTDSKTGESLAGATLQILDKDRNVIREWITDGTGIFSVEGLTKGETYTLHESGTPDGYYYSYDVQFTVTGEKDQKVEMRNREIIVVTPPDEYPDPKPDPEGTHPDYELKKERVSLAPEKGKRDEYGFFRGDKVLYDVTVTNTGETRLSMTVTDTFEKAEYFSIPKATGVRFYKNGGHEGITMGEIVSLEGNTAKIKLEVGGYAVIRYEAYVLDEAKEFLSGHTVDDGLGYLNTARSTDVVGTYTEYTGDDNDGDGKGDTPVEKTVTKEDYPDELGDKEDTANTPVQEPDNGGENPSYVMDKTRPTLAPEKGETSRYGFHHGDTVDYDVHIANTGGMPLKMYVTDEFDYRISRYFTEPVVKKVEGNMIAENGTGIGTAIVKIRLEPGEEAVVTFTATVKDTAPEKLAFFATDDGNGYLNIAKTYQVRAEKPDGTEGGPDEYPGIPDKEDEANTPVQTEEEKPDYPYIWLMKNEVNDPDHVLAGGTFQVLSEDKSTVLIEDFTMNSTWQQWNVVLEADKTYWLHEVTPPEGYLRAEDVKFTVSHYGEDIHVSMTDEPVNDEVDFVKEDLAGNSVRGAALEVRAKGSDEVYAWVSDGTPHTISKKLKPEGTYIYHEVSVPEGYVRSADIEFTLDEKGVVADAHYVDADGMPVLYDKDGYVTGIRVMEDGRYELNGETVRIDRDGNAVDKDKKVVAEGVKLEIDVTGNTVIMKDAPTDVTIKKTDSKTGQSLAGATLQVIDKDDKVIAEWTTDESGTFKLEKKLTAGETYILREKETVDGYYYSYDIAFTVNEDGRPQTVEMRNREIIVVTPPDTPDEPDDEKPIIWLLKHSVGDKDHILQGGTFQVLSEDKSEVVIDTFTMDGTWQEWDTALKADHSYWLHEVTAPDGYKLAEDVKFTVSHYGEEIQVDMVDEPTDVIFKKTDSTTGQSLAGAVLQVIDKDGKIIEEWTTDGTGIFKMTNKLTAGETYTLHEEETVEGYYYSYDVQFTVNNDGESQIIEMRNREIKVVTPPDETPEPKPEPQGTHPDYSLTKERVSLAPEKGKSGEYGFFRGDRVLYDVTVTNTGETDLSMTVTDNFEKAEYFSTPEATAVRFYHKDGREGTTMGEIVSMEGNTVKLKLAVGGYAVIRYEADVLDEAKELLSGHAVDDGLGYLNTARTTDVVGTYTEYSGEDKNGDGKGDTVTEKTVTKEDYPDELGDKEDTANTPVQEPDEDGENPSYTMDKTRTTKAPEKGESGRYGFRRGDTVTYVVRITNTGDMPLKMYVADEFDYRIRKHFEDLKITEIDGEAIDEDGTGVGTTVARIRIEPGEEVAVTFTAKVAETAPEKLSYHTDDDGNGYLNVAKTYDVKAEKPDGTEGDKEEYPGIPDKEDDGNTPVQTEDKPDYPYIWLLKNEVNDPDHILRGGTFQVLSEDKEHILIDNFTMNGTWQQWDVVLEADKSYWLHEVSAPAGYKKAEDVKFTVSHYGEDVQVVMSDEKLPNKVTFTKEDFAGTEIPGAECELERVEPNGTTTKIDSWISGEEPHVMEDTLSGSTTYRYHEEKAPNGYGYSEDIEFTVDENGKVTDAHYVDKDGTPILYDKDGFPTTITVQPDGTYKDGDTKVTINKDGNAVDWRGHIHAEGVKYEIEVVDNVVRMKDAPTRVTILKKSIDGKALEGGQFVIKRIDGSIVEALHDTQIPSTEHEGNILKGEAVRFAATENGVEITRLLNGSETYILHEEKAPAGYSLASDVRFTVPRDGKPITVTMLDTKKPDDPTPSYDMDKERTSEAPEKGSTGRYGFKHGDTVTYEAHITNTGDLTLKMYVSDEFAPEARGFFENLQITKIEGAEDISEDGMGIGKDTARIRLMPGKTATITFTAVVGENAPENLAFGAMDDGNGYENIVKTYDVKAEKPDGSEGDKEEYPDIPDKEDDADTPVQEPEEPTPSYTMDKERTSEAPEKGETGRYGFHRGDTVTYESHITNTGDLPLKMYVSDEYAPEAKEYFENLQIVKIVGAEDISEDGMGIGADTARIRLMPGKTAIVTFTATVSQSAPENLAFSAADDGHGYRNTVKTYNVKAEKPDGTEGGPEEYPEIPDKDDDAETPVQEPEKPEEPTPSYTMDKERKSEAPEKGSTGRYGFHRGDTVTYESHITNTGDLPLKMYVSDEYAPEVKEYFENLQITKIESAEDISEEGMGVGKDTARIRLMPGKTATVTFTAVVSSKAPENLAFSAVDDGHGYRNTVKTYSVKAEKPDGTEGGPEEYPGIPDKDDDADTPVQEPKEPTPSYDMDKERKTAAPEKGSTGRYGFKRGDTVTYEAHITNTGDLALKMYVSDEFAPEAKGYFENLKIVKIEGAEDISEDGMGVGKDTARIRLLPGKTATVTFTAVVSSKAPENLAFSATDDGRGYKNTVKTYNVKAEKPDGTEGGPEEYPGIPDKEDDADTPVQEPKKPNNPGGGGSTPSKPYVTVYKYDGNTMEPINGVTFQVYRDGAEFAKVKTDKSGYARVNSLTDGSYRIVETEAAKGYQLSSQEFTFTVTNGVVAGGVTTFHMANYKETTVTVTKRDGDNGTPLKGARLRIADEDGGVAYEGVTGKDGTITFKVTKPGHYAVIELEAPKGYDVVDGYITFHVAEDGTVSGTTTMYDYKKERKGKITAKYENGFERGGWYDSDGRWHKLPSTGDTADNSRMPYLFGIFAASMCGIVLLSRKKKKKKA